MENMKAKFWNKFNIILNIIVDVLFVIVIIWCFVSGYYVTAILGLLYILVDIAIDYYERKNIYNNVYVSLARLRALIIFAVFVVCRRLNI